MASNFGFVYLLGNDYMPDVFKIGFSDRAPHQRAQELSASTSCPHPFHVVCYIEVEDAPSREKDFHRNFAANRISDNREFFHVTSEQIRFLLSAFTYYPKKLSITKCANFLDLLESSRGYAQDGDVEDLLWDVYKKRTELELVKTPELVEVVKQEEKQAMEIPF